MAWQVWLLAVLWIVAGARTPVRLAMTAACAAVSVLALPSSLWRPQLSRLARLSFFIFILVAIGSGVQKPGKFLGIGFANRLKHIMQ